jgi:hypothetical protein
MPCFSGGHSARLRDENRSFLFRLSERPHECQIGCGEAIRSAAPRDIQELLVIGRHSDFNTRRGEFFPGRSTSHLIVAHAPRLQRRPALT